MLFQKICATYITHLEKEYQTKYSHLTFVKYLRLPDDIRKYTVEIILDEYYDLLSKNYFTSENDIICSMLAFKGNFSLLKFANKSECPIDKYTIRCASYSGHLDILDWLLVNLPKTEYEESVRHNAVIGSQVGVLEWLHAKTQINFSELESEAITNGRIVILEWMIKNNLVIDFSKCFKDGAKFGYVHLLQWAHDQGSKPSSQSYIHTAIEHNHPKILQWAFDHNYIMETPRWEVARKTDVLNWALDHGYILDDSFYAHVVRLNKSEFLQWAFDRDNKYKLYDGWSTDAVQNGCLKILDWAKDHGYELDNSLGELAVRHYRTNTLGWLIENKIITEPIAVNVENENKDLAILLFQKNLLKIGAKSYLKLIELGVIGLEAIQEEYFTTRKQYHFIIGEKTNHRIKYGDSDDCTNQKIIYYNQYGYPITDDFNCGLKCWFYFWLFDQMGDYNIFRPIYQCKVHQKYVEKLK
jgi:hypothetical protein